MCDFVKIISLFEYAMKFDFPIFKKKWVSIGGLSKEWTSFIVNPNAQPVIIIATCNR